MEIDSKKDYNKNLKILLFASKIDNDLLIKNKESPQNPIDTGFFFMSKINNKNNLKIKAHFTNPAMNMVKANLIEKFGRDKTKIILKEFFKTLEHLTINNTALLSLYLPKTYLSYKVRNDLDSDANK